MSFLSKLFGKKSPAVETTSPQISTLSAESPTPPAPADPEWKYQQTYREGHAQVASAAQQGGPLESQTPSPTPTTEAANATRPEWIRKEEPRLQQGYAKEGIAQVPQVPQAIQTPPSPGEIKG